jgi:hypothetical protein
MKRNRCESKRDRRWITKINKDKNLLDEKTEEEDRRKNCEKRNKEEQAKKRYIVKKKRNGTRRIKILGRMGMDEEKEKRERS